MYFTVSSLIIVLLLSNLKYLTGLVDISSKRRKIVLSSLSTVTGLGI